MITESIQRFLYSKLNLQCVTNIYNYCFDDEAKECDFRKCCVFDAMGIIFTLILCYRFSLLL